VSSIDLSSSTTIQPAQKTPTDDAWRIVITEVIHLLGLFLTHARHAKGARATHVLFDQLVKRLDMLAKMPGHDGGMILRRIGSTAGGGPGKPDYFFLFGDLAFSCRDALVRNAKNANRISYLSGALEQACGYFQEQGIHAIYMQLPGRSEKAIDQLRLSLNIVARFRQAVESNASITFHYFGRAMTVPLIFDASARPDPNLTLVAGLNSLSSVNMRELIKQADAFRILSPRPQQTAPAVNSYNQIFSVRSLRSQLIQPLIEINNLPWMLLDSDRVTDRGNESTPVAQLPQNGQALENNGCSDPAERPIVLEDVVQPDIVAHFLRSCLDTKDAKAYAAIDALRQYDYTSTGTGGLGKHFSSVSLLLHALDKHDSGALPRERLVAYLHNLLERIPETVLNCLTVQRRALKIEKQGRTVLVGMLHPSLADLLLLVKQAAALRHKMTVARAHTFNTGLNPTILGKFVRLNAPDALRLENCLASLLTERGDCDRNVLATHIDLLAEDGDGIFAMLWCYLRLAQQESDRCAFMDGLLLISEHLPTLQASLGLLLCDVFQFPIDVAPSDRNAFRIASQMLRTMHKESLYIRSTPEEVLAVRKSLNPTLVKFASERMDIDAIRTLSKFDALRQALFIGMVDHAPAAEGQDVASLFHMQREGLILMVLAGGNAAHRVLREALAYYGDFRSEIYQDPRCAHYLPDCMAQLRVVLRGMIRLGRTQDIALLKKVEQFGSQWMALDAVPGFARSVKKTMQWVAPAIRAIQVRCHD